jgi:hypothetical protein
MNHQETIVTEEGRVKSGEKGERRKEIEVRDRENGRVGRMARGARLLGEGERKKRGEGHAFWRADIG